MFFWRKKNPTPGEEIVGLLKFAIVVGGAAWFVQIFSTAQDLGGSSSAVADQIRQAREAIPQQPAQPAPSVQPAQPKPIASTKQQAEQQLSALTKDLGACKQQGQAMCEKIWDTAQLLSQEQRDRLIGVADAQCSSGVQTACEVGKQVKFADSVANP